MPRRPALLPLPPLLDDLCCCRSTFWLQTSDFSFQTSVINLITSNICEKLKTRSASLQIGFVKKSMIYPSTGSCARPSVNCVGIPPIPNDVPHETSSSSKYRSLGISSTSFKITLVVCLTMSLTHAYPKLAPNRPPRRLLSPPLLLSIILNILFTLTVQVFAFLYVKQQPWYSVLCSHRGCPTADHPVSLGNGTASNATAPEHSVLSYEDTTLWPLVTVNCTPTIWRVYVLLMLLVAFSVSFFVEDGILQNHRLWLLIKALFRFRSSSQYWKLQWQLEEDAKWPPTSQKDFAEQPKSGAYVNPVYDEAGEN
ncbi:Hypothetical predicted protein [Podarcis lilfordi]|uniref:Uncharacterized protein n=1 Tax=Podarcis lilfordi TaxID=74358 RepID=A0AA35QQJ8_9SAUR|nr:Hypothetical predicted protein [Podarcis lilfordi]